MRLILTILLIGLFKADAQIVINASQPYRPVGISPLFDNFAGAFGFSLRKLRTSYTGAAIRVRKDTTGQPEQDIGFLGSGELDTVSLKSFLNARSGFVTTWYDQSTNGFNATQATQAQQPRIALTGVIERISGKPTVKFDGSNDRLLTTTVIANNGSFSAFAVTRADALGNTHIWDADNNSARVAQYIRLAGATTFSFITIVFVGVTNYTAGSANINTTTNYIISSHLSSNNLNTVLNNTVNAATPVVGTMNANSVIHGIGCRTNATAFYNGRISEIIHYAIDNYSNRSAIENNINAFYGIY